MPALHVTSYFLSTLLAAVACCSRTLSGSTAHGGKRGHGAFTLNINSITSIATHAATFVRFCLVYFTRDLNDSLRCEMAG